MKKPLKKQSEGLSLNDKFSILLKKRLSGVVEQGHAMLYGESRIIEEQGEQNSIAESK